MNLQEQRLTWYCPTCDSVGGVDVPNPCPPHVADGAILDDHRRARGRCPGVPGHTSPFWRPLVVRVELLSGEIRVGGAKGGTR